MKSSDFIHIRTPLSDAMISELRAGDKVLITGELITARDAAHKRFAELLDKGDNLPFDPQGQIIYYLGPAPARPGRIIGPGAPTTAERMDAFTPALLAKGIKGLIGKGGRSSIVRSALQEYKAVYFTAVAGASVLLSKPITATEIICYHDLGTEAVRRLKVENFPVIVVNDTQGGDLYEKNQNKWSSLLKKNHSDNIIRNIRVNM